MKFTAFFSLLFTLLSINMSANSRLVSVDYSQLTVVPYPQHIEPIKGTGFVLQNGVIISVADSTHMLSADYLSDYIKRYYNIDCQIVNRSGKSSVKRGKKGVIYLSTGSLSRYKSPFTKEQLAVEGSYYANISYGVVELKGANEQGLFYAVQTLLQMLPGGQNGNVDHLDGVNVLLEIELPAVKVFDFPRFEYRGMHLDVVRHIYSVDYIKQYLDYIAMHKMNYFHWHLTDDQGWRMESKSHPLLNEIGSWRAGTIIGIFPGTGVDSTRYGGYYTIEQMKEIIDYAAKRYITVVPEIDIPGHSMAILATYPHFSTTPDIPKQPAITWGIYNRQNNVLAPSEEVFSFLDDVFNELMDVFPGPYIHIGADECAKRWWKECEKTQQFIKEHNLEDENGLQRYFAERVSETIHARGRRFIGWDEMIDAGLVDGAIVMSWRNASNGVKAAKMGHKVIMTPSRYSYFNIAQRENEDSLCHNSRVVSLDSVYLFEPVPRGMDKELAKNIIGGQGCMWTEYFPHRERLEYGIFPRMSAISEVYWTLPKNRDIVRFRSKLPQIFRKYDLWGANYYSGNLND